MKLIMENWRNFLKEDDSHSPCDALKVQKVWFEKFQQSGILYGERYGNTNPMRAMPPSADNEEKTNIRIDAYNKVLKIIPKYQEKQIEKNTYFVLDRGPSYLNVDEKYHKELYTDLNNQKDTFSKYLFLQSRIDALTSSTNLSIFKGNSSNPDQSRKILALKKLRNHLAKGIDIAAADFIKNNSNPQDARSLDDQCRASKSDELDSELFDDSGDWHLDLKRIPQLIDQSDSEYGSGHGRRLFGLLWRYSNGKHYIVAPGIKIRKSGLDSVKIQGFGPIRGYYDALKIAAEKEGYTSGQADFEDWLSFWISKGPVKGLDWVFSKSVSSGQRY